MKKFILDLTVTENIKLHANYVLLKLTSQSLLPEMLPGQFAELRVDGSPTTFLRRPISINFVDKQRNEVWFLIQLLGDGTRRLAEVNPGDVINVVLPLGNGYTMPQNPSDKLLLVGGGVGTAPMLYLGEQLAKNGHKPTFLLGARSDKDLLQLEEFVKYGEVYTTTEDGSHGEKGYVTQHSILNKVRFEQIYTCGPKPMMVAVAKYAKSNQIECEVSLENTMACGIGACLCCVENTTEGHLCVCKEGPVFNINKLWPECRFVSLGGATEAAIWSVYYEVHILDEPWTSIPYGRPLANQLLRVVNNKGKDSPVGVPGELWIGGYGVAEGYVNEEKLTQERFVKIDGIRWYKTGDKAQYFQDGNVQFLGRLDDQVKVNGYRIELGEIENVIKRAECIDDAIAMTVETNGKKEIVAAVVEKYEKGNASHQVFMNEENPEYAEIQEIRKKVVAAFILKVYGNNVDSLTPNDNIVINSNGKVEQYWNVWLLINNVISHKDSDEYVLNLEIKNVLSDIWYMKLETQIPMVQELIRGTVSASNLLTNGYLSPEELLVQGSDTVIFLEHVTKVIKHDSKVAVLGARTGLAVEMLLNNNLDRNVELTLIDESAGMLKRAEERLRRYDVQFEYYHFEDGLLEKSLLGQFDFVIALGELHRYKNPLHGLHVANMLLKAKGQLLALEYEDLDPMSIISSAILENGFSEYMRKRKNTALMTVDEWLTAFEESAFDDVMIKVYPTSSALFINANANKYKEYLKELEEYVRNSLVQYMLPQEFITFTWFPLSQNGKVDRKKIRQIVGNRKRTMVKNTDYVGVEREIAELWKEMLSVEDIGRNDNFFEIGGDSLLATQFVECLKQKYEIEMSLREIFNNAELDRVSKIIEEKIECNKQMIEGEI